MVYAYVSSPSLRAEWHVEEIEAEDLKEAQVKYRVLRKKYPNYAAHSLVSGPSLEIIKQAYSEKLY